MPKTTVNPGDFVEFDHPLTRRVEYGYVMSVTRCKLVAWVRSTSGEEMAIGTFDLYDPERYAHMAAA